MTIKTVGKDELLGRLLDLASDLSVGELIQLIENLTEEEE